VEKSTITVVTKSVSASLTNLGFTYAEHSQLWETIARSLIQLEDEHLKNGSFKDIVEDLAKAGYKDPEFWKEIKQFIVKNRQNIDGQTYIELRNTHVQYFPNQVAMISFLEQKSISSLFLFGRSHRHPLFKGAITSKHKKSIPSELHKTLKKLEASSESSQVAKQVAKTIKKIVK
jgi:hypothetical protein